jgi:monovalent cation:H+ antiporter, CPA1 family
MDYIKAEQLELILLVGAIVAIIVRRFRIPYTAGLVAAGVVIAFLPLDIQIPFSRELLFKVLLPPLIFEAALYINWRELRKDLPLVGVLATIGVLISAGVTALLMHYAGGWTWQASVLFGVLIAATDPVSVIATFKEAGMKGRLRLLVESESLFNDATAAVAFSAALALVAGEQTTAGLALWMMVKSVAGAVTVGAAIGGGVLLLTTRTPDPLVELSLTTIAAFGSFWLAEHFQMSGIMATMTAGLLIGNLSSFGMITEKGAETMESFWEFAGFAANSVVFISLGISAAHQNFGPVVVSIILAIAIVVIARAVTIYPLAVLFHRSSLKVPLRQQHVLFWGGLRGALALALALGIPDNMPFRNEIVLTTFGVVAFSVFVQGLTMTPVLRRLGQLPEGEAV